MENGKWKTEAGESRINRRSTKVAPKLSGVLYAFLAIAFIIYHSSFITETSAHRYHTTLTRIDYNQKEKIFEISIKLFTHDLLPLLEKRSGKRVEIEKSAEADKLIFDYLNENFVLSDKSGAVKILKWIGKESDVDTVEVYLEADASENLEGYKLRNTLFFDNFPEQTNLVVCRYDGVKADLLFRGGEKIKEIVGNKTTTEK